MVAIPNPFKPKEPVETGAPPVNPDVPEPNPGAAQRKKILIGAGLGLGILVMFAIVPAIMLSGSKKPSATPTNSLSITPTPSVDPKATSQLGPERIFLTVSATSTVPYLMQMTVPSGWQARFVTQPSKAYPWEDSILTRAIISQFSPLSSTNTSLSSGNYIALMDISGWLKSNRNVLPMTVAQKQQWYAALAGIDPENYTRVTATLTNPRVANESGGRQHIQPVAIAENGLKGVSYITNTSNTDYAPQIILMLVGSYEGRQYVIYAQHNVRDQAWASISALKARSDSGTAGQIAATTSDFSRGVLGQDTIAIHDEFLKAVQSTSFKPAE